MPASQSGRDARLGDGCFTEYYASHMPREVSDELRQSGRGRAARAGAMQDLVPRRYRPSGGLDLNFFGGLSPRWAVANLYGLLATKILAQDIFDRGAHLLLEPESHIAGIIFRALEDQLVVDEEEEMSAASRILRDLLQSEVEDVPSGRLDRDVEALGVFGHGVAFAIFREGDHAPPAQDAPRLPLLPCPIALLPIVEGREGGPEGLPIFYGLFTRQGFTGVLVNVGPVLIDAKAVEEAEGSPLGGRPSLHRPLLADQLGRGPEVDVLPIRERLEHGAVLGVVGSHPELLLG